MNEELKSLYAKLEASKRVGVGYKDRIIAIEKRISELEAQSETQPNPR